MLGTFSAPGERLFESKKKERQSEERKPRGPKSWRVALLLDAKAPIAAAGNLLQTIPVANFDQAAHPGENATALERFYGLRHGRTPHAENAREQLLGNAKLVPIAAILRGEQPAGEALAK